MNNFDDRAEAAAKLREQALGILSRTGFPELFESRFGQVALTGSVRYDLMVWPDIDLNMPVGEARRLDYFALGGEMAQRLGAAGLRLHRAQFLDDYVDPHPLGPGLYWGIDFREASGARWKCDIWGWEPADFLVRQEKDRILREALATADRDLILRLKTEARGSPESYGSIVPSIVIYRFVIARAGTSLEELLDWEGRR